MPTFDPIETSNQFTSDRVWEAFQSKYITAGNYAVWAQTLLENNLKNINDILKDDTISPKLENLLSLIDGISIYTPSAITSYTAPVAPTYDTPGTYTAPTMGTIQTVPAYSAPTIGVLSDVPYYVKPDSPVYETIPDYVAPTIGTLTDVPVYKAPTAPKYDTLPVYTAPVLSAMLDIPELVPISIPDAPSTAIAFANSDFSDTLLTSVKSSLAAALGAGSTGLGNAEAALFARETARQNAARSAAYTEITTQFSARGFDMPPGTLLAKQTEANNQTALILSDSSSQIMAESARLAVDYNKHVLSVIVQLEDMLGRLHDSKVMRDFEAAKTTVQLDIEGFKAIIEAEVARGNLQKAFVDAVVTANDGYVKVFLGELQGQLEPIKAVTEVNKAKVEQYSAEIKAAIAPLEAIVQTNEAVIKKYLGELQAATDPIKALADINKSYAQVYLADLDAAIKPIQATIDRNSGVIKQYLGEIEGEITPIKALIEMNTNVVKQYEAEAAAKAIPIKTVIENNQQKAVAYGTAIQAAAETVKSSAINEDFKIKQNDLELKGAQVKSAAMSDATKMALDSAYREMTTSVETMKAVALQAAQLIASSFNTVTAGVSLGYDAKSNTSYNGNVDTLSANVKYQVDNKQGAGVD